MDRNWNLALLAAKEETTDGTEAAPSAVAEAISQLIEPFPADFDFAFAHPRPRQVRGNIIEAGRPVGATGKVGTWAYGVHGRGSRAVGAAYNANPAVAGGLELQPLLVAAGCSVVHSGAPGSEIVTVRPAATALKSATLYYYQDGTLYRLFGAKNDIAIEIDAGGPVRFNVTSTGLYQVPGASAVPAPTAAQLGAQLPPLCENTTVSLNFGGGASTSAIVRSFRMGFGNTPSQRGSFAGPGGLAPHKIRFREPTCTLVVEQPVGGSGPPLYDLENLMYGPPGTVSFVVGAVQYNRIGFTLHPVITGLRKQDDNGTVVAELTCSLHSSDGVALDAFEIVFS